MLTSCSEAETISRNKMKWYLLFIAALQLQLAIIQGQATGLQTCKSIKQSNPASPSKMYTINVGSTCPPKQIEVYCEMGLNGGGYTFLTPESIVQLQPSELASIFTDRTSFLLRVRKTDGSQPYAVLKQLPQYAHIALKLGLSEYSGYNPPVNTFLGDLVGQRFLYFGFLSKLYAANDSLQGLQVNGVNNMFTNYDKNPNSYFTLFPNFPEALPSTYDVPGAFCDKMFSQLLQNPSGRAMPPQIYMFGETHFGGACFKQTNKIPGVLSFAIGFR